MMRLLAGAERPSLWATLLASEDLRHVVARHAVAPATHPGSQLKARMAMNTPPRPSPVQGDRESRPRLRPQPAPSGSRYPSRWRPRNVTCMLNPSPRHHPLHLLVEATHHRWFPAWTRLRSAVRTS